MTLSQVSEYLNISKTSVKNIVRNKKNSNLLIKQLGTGSRKQTRVLKSSLDKSRHLQT